ncbi:hypothetical protein RHSIM_Rhsim06G0087700 [Rhododendron simsii]|uniref:Uncharacterized protein n=1 Tax=Rhododendron simsii TaxID=118357 RepID=A0A834GVB8_RHOSS|nr:hypothetical protein RHSIM_Rhsim06G0087700 [Rhododendron simsii]
MLLHLVMDKSWMKLGSTAHGRTSQPCFDGVNSFLEYAAAVGDQQVVRMQICLIYLLVQKLIDQMQTNGNRVPDLKEVYNSTHFNEDTKMWISEESEKNYGNIIEVEAGHAEAGVTPITQEELSIKSLKAKSGYVKDWV